MIATTISKAKIAQALAKGLPSHKPFQWNGIHFIGYNVVRYDVVMTEEELYSQDWIRIKNILSMEFYKVYLTQKLVAPDEAIDPGKLNPMHLDGWEVATFGLHANTLKIVAAWKQISYSPFYAVSFVRFTKWKTNALSALLRK